MQVSNHLDLVRVAHNDPETKKMKDLMFAMTAFDTDDSSLLYQVSHLTLPYLTLPYLTLPYLTLPYLTLPYLALPCLTLPDQQSLGAGQ